MTQNLNVVFARVMQNLSVGFVRGTGSVLLCAGGLGQSCRLSTGLVLQIRYPFGLYLLNEAVFTRWGEEDWCVGAWGSGWGVYRGRD